MSRGVSTLPTELLARYERLFAWELDRRCKAVREVASDLFELWQDLGTVENLSAQKRLLCERALCERVVYLRPGDALRTSRPYSPALRHRWTWAPTRTTQTCLWAA